MAVTNELKQFDRKVGPHERPAMPPVKVPDKMAALGREGPMKKEEPGTLRGDMMERRVMW